MGEMAVTPTGRIAVVGGTGPEGAGLALRWAAAGLDVIIGSRDESRAMDSAGRIAEKAVTARGGEGVRIAGMTNPTAVAQAQIVVLTVPFAAQQSTLKSVLDAFHAGQTLVDVTVPLAVAVGGRATHVLGVWEGSAAEAAAGAVPPGIGVVAAFHNVSASHLEHLEAPVDCDVLVCGDDRAAKKQVRPMVEAIAGCRYVDAGPLANARIVESLTALLIGVNIRYRVPGAGIRLTGLPAAPGA